MKLRPKVSQTVIAESAFNDVTAAVLTLTLVGVVETGGFALAGPAPEFVKELALRSVIGVFAGAVLCFGIRLIAIRRGWRLPVAHLPQRFKAGADVADDQQDKVGKL